MINGDLEVLQTCVDWLKAGHQVELVTVVKTWGSSPKPVGSLAAVRDDGVLVGSVSGGCVEKQLSESFRGKRMARVHAHHIDDQQARRYGLACGGQLELVYETLDDVAQLQTIISALQQRERVARTVMLDTIENQATDSKTPTVIVEKVSDESRFFYDSQRLTKVFGPQWQILIIGAGQLSAFVAQFAAATDFSVLVCDPRPEFIKAWNTPDSVLLNLEPHDAVIKHANSHNTAVLALTHDPNLDDGALLEALPMPCFFVGALGSKRNYERRCKRLAHLLNPADLDKLHSPVGLDIASRSSAEIAVSIVAQLIQVRAMINRPVVHT